jgi:serine protease AprX
MQYTASRRTIGAVGAAVVTVGAVLTLFAAPAHATTQTAWSSDPTLTNTGVASGADKARSSYGVDGRGVGVALIDTGVAPVPGLPASRIRNGPDLSLESQAPNLRYLDTNGHGTHMAGIIAGSDSAAGFTGVAPGAKITSIKVGAADGAVDASQVIAALDWVVAHRNDDTTAPIKVINLSYGTDSMQDYKVDPLNMAVENAWKAGIVVVVAGGNTGITNRLTSPATDPYVLSVGSINAKNQPMMLWNGTATVSPFSASTTGRKVDIAAPGQSDVSLRNPGSFVDTAYPTARVGTALFKGSGTSQAAAVVSGGVALILQKHPTWSPDIVKKMIQMAGTSIPNLSPADQGIKQINVYATAGSNYNGASNTQSFTAAAGTGSLELARGTSHIVDASVPLSGERTLLGPFTSGTWAAASKAKTSWQGGLWMGQRLAGDGWTGTSWASKTWAAATWTGTSWSSSPWDDIDWSGRAWSGRAWSGRAWSGTAWTGRYWSSSQWSSAGWTF